MTQELTKARRHQAILWIGIIMTLIAVAGLITSIVLFAQGAEWKLMLAFFLASFFFFNAFGINNTTSLSYYGRVYESKPELLTDKEKEEIEAEEKKNNPALKAEPTTKTAYVVTLISFLLFTLAVYKLLQVLG